MSGGAGPEHKDLLAEFLIASAKIAKRLSWSMRRLAHIMPLDEDAIRHLGDEDEESLRVPTSVYVSRFDAPGQSRAIDPRY